MAQKAIRVTTNRKKCRVRPLRNVQSIDMTAPRIATNEHGPRVGNEAPEESKEGSQMDMQSLRTLNRDSQSDNRLGSQMTASMLQAEQDQSGISGQPPYQKVNMQKICSTRHMSHAR